MSDDEESNNSDELDNKPKESLGKMTQRHKKEQRVINYKY